MGMDNDKFYNYRDRQFWMMSEIKTKLTMKATYRLSDLLLLEYGVLSDLLMNGEGDSHDLCDLRPSSSSSHDELRSSSKYETLNSINWITNFIADNIYENLI